MTSRFPLLVVLALAACGRAPEPPPPVSKPKPKPAAMIFGTVDADAAAIYASIDWKKDPLPDEVEIYRPPNVAARPVVDQALKDYDKQLTSLARAARANRCAWKPGRLDAFAPKPDVISSLKGAHLLRTLFLRRMEEQRKMEAIETLVTGLKFGADHMADPRTLSKLAGCLLIAIQADAFQRASATQSFDRSELEFLERHLAALAGRIPSAEKVLLDERKCMDDSIDVLLEMGFAKAIKALQFKPEPERESGLMDTMSEILAKDRSASKAAISGRLDEVFALMVEDSRGLLNAKEIRFDFAAFKDRASDALAKWVLGGGGKDGKALRPASDMVILILTLPHLKIRENFAIARLQMEALRLWARLQRIGIEKGAYPESLQGLPEIPRDPFDGKPIKYVRRPFGDLSVFALTAAGPAEDWADRFVALEKHYFDPHMSDILGRSTGDAFIYTWVGRMVPRPRPK